MIEIFVLIGWLDGFKSGGSIAQEFNSLATCEAAKQVVVEKHNIGDEWGQSSESWVTCVKK